ncbi:MAG: hypothetical protein WDN25_04020 [Acetobacteraceae bacterium]
MPGWWASFVSETATNPGTGAVTLLGRNLDIPCCDFATAGYGTGDPVYYTISDGAPDGQSEDVRGTYNATTNTLSRDETLANTAGTTSPLSFTGDVFIYSVLPASKGLALDAGNDLTLPRDLSVTRNAAIGGTLAIQPASAAAHALRADQAWQTIASYPPSIIGLIDFPLSTGYRRFRLWVSGLTVTFGDATIGLQFSGDNGSTFATSLYNWAAHSVLDAGSLGGAGNASDVSITVAPGIAASAGSNAFEGMIDIFPGSVSFAPRCVTTMYGVTSAGYMLWQGGGGWNGSPGRMNYGRLLPSAGTISAALILEGLR